MVWKGGLRLKKHGHFSIYLRFLGSIILRSSIFFGNFGNVWKKWVEPEGHLGWWQLKWQFWEFSCRKLGKMNPFWLPHIFEMGWNFNHQLVAFWKRRSKLEARTWKSWRSLRSAHGPRSPVQFLEFFGSMGRTVYLHIFTTYIWPKFMVFHADRYTSPMDPMVLVKRQWVWFSPNSQLSDWIEKIRKNDSKQPSISPFSFASYVSSIFRPLKKTHRNINKGFLAI